jgi:drug/metabolite transporter (DMT)-like permease
MGRQSNDIEYTPEETAWYRHLLADLALLDKAARHLRGLGWWGFFIIGMVCFPLVVALAFMKQPAFVVVVVAGAVIALTVVVAPYFFLARFVGRGRSWAVICALVLIGFMLLISCFTILHDALISKRPMAVILETGWLISHLNQIKLLCLCSGAANRLSRRSLPPLTALPAED